MFKISAFFILLLALATPGCNLLTIEHHNQAISAIHDAQSNVHAQMLALSTKIDEQKNVIYQLSEEVSSLANNITLLTQAQTKLKKSLEEEPQIVYVEKEVKTELMNNKIILGEKEWVWLDDANENFHARVDTGATTSSLNARQIEEFERDGKNWVRFDLVYQQDNEIKEKKLEAPLIRFVRIRQSSSDKLERRPVVSLRIRIGDLHEKAQFTLTDRSHMQFPILLGREFFKDLVIVDVSRSYIYPPHPEKEIKTP